MRAVQPAKYPLLRLSRVSLTDTRHAGECAVLEEGADGDPPEGERRQDDAQRQDEHVAAEQDARCRHPGDAQTGGACPIRFLLIRLLLCVGG